MKSLRLVWCEFMDKKLVKAREETVRIQTVLNKQLKLLSQSEFIQFGINRGYDSKTYWETK